MTEETMKVLQKMPTDYCIEHTEWQELLLSCVPEKDRDNLKRVIMLEE